MATLTIRDGLTGAPGGTVTVPIEIDDAGGLQSVQLSIQYDTELLDLIDPNPDTDVNENVVRTGITTDWGDFVEEGTVAELEEDNILDALVELGYLNEADIPDDPDETITVSIQNPVNNVNEEAGTIQLALINPGPTPEDNTEGDIVEINFQISDDADLGDTANIDIQSSRLGINGEEVNDSTLEDGSVTVGEGGGGANLDIDGNGSVTIQDGLLTSAYITFTQANLDPGPALDGLIDAGIIGSDPTREGGSAVADYLEQAGNSLLDADGNDSTTIQDGLLISAYITFTQANLDSGAALDGLIDAGIIGSDPTRDTGGAIADFLQALTPPQAQLFASETAVTGLTLDGNEVIL